MDFNVPIPNILPAGHIRTVWEHLNNEVADLIKTLPEDHELIANVILFNGDMIQVEEFSYAGPNLLIVIGKRNNNKTVTYIHQSSLQVVFSIVPKDVKVPRKAIGFIKPDEDLSEDK